MQQLRLSQKSFEPPYLPDWETPAIGPTPHSSLSVHAQVCDESQPKQTGACVFDRASAKSFELQGVHLGRRSLEATQRRWRRCQSAVSVRADTAYAEGGARRLTRFRQHRSPHTPRQGKRTQEASQGGKRGQSCIPTSRTVHALGLALGF